MRLLTCRSRRFGNMTAWATRVRTFGTQRSRPSLRQERRGDQPSFKRILTAIGVDWTNGEVWIALNNNLQHFDKEGNRRATYKIYTPQGARLEASTILVEQDRLIIGSDPLGIYEFDRPDKKIGKRASFPQANLRVSCEKFTEHVKICS